MLLLAPAPSPPAQAALQAVWPRHQPCVSMHSAPSCTEASLRLNAAAGLRYSEHSYSCAGHAVGPVGNCALQALTRATWHWQHNRLISPVCGVSHLACNRGSREQKICACCNSLPSRVAAPCDCLGYQDPLDTVRKAPGPWTMGTTGMPCKSLRLLVSSHPA